MNWSGFDSGGDVRTVISFRLLSEKDGVSERLFCFEASESLALEIRDDPIFSPMRFLTVAEKLWIVKEVPGIWRDYCNWRKAAKK